MRVRVAAVVVNTLAWGRFGRGDGSEDGEGSHC